MNTRAMARTVCSLAAGATLALGGAAPALAAKHHRHHRSHTTRHTANSSSSSSSSSSTSSGSTETALTGSNLSSASAAALAAVPGGTVTRASTETDSSDSSAAYEVHVTKSDGSHVVVIEDSSFKVLSTTAEQGHGNCSGAHGTGTTGSSGGTTSAT